MEKNVGEAIKDGITSMNYRVLLRKWRAKRRLKRIEKATGIRLMPHQREIALIRDRPVFDYTWGRGRGKTTASVFWALMWRAKPIEMINEQNKLHKEISIGLTEKLPAIPDHDATNYNRLRYTLQQYIYYSVKCTQKGIQVATVTEKVPL